jgi:hypothetical protein
VRPIQGNINRYTVGDVPATQDEMPAYLRRELDKIQAAINVIADGQLDVTTVAPTKPRDGMIRRASGAPNWNPGSGQGVYCYYAGSWKFLG